MAEAQPGRPSRRAEETLDAPPASALPGRQRAGTTIAAPDSGRTGRRFGLRRGGGSGKRAPQTIALGPAPAPGVAARSGASPPQAAPQAATPPQGPARAAAAPPARAPAAEPRRSPAWALVLVGTLAIVAVCVSTLAIQSLLESRRSVSPTIQLRRLGAGVTVEAARAGEGGDNPMLQPVLPSFFACAEYRNSPQEALYAFSLTPQAAVFDRTATLAHGNFPGPAGNYTGCTTVQFDSGGRPAPGTYTLWLERLGSGGGSEILGRLLLTFR